MKETRELARFVAETRFDDIPRDVIEQARILVLDNLASGLLGSVQPWSNMVAGLVQDAGGKSECSVFGKDWRTSQSAAALVNGVMIGAFEAEHYLPAGAHPSGSVFPAVLAVAEREHKDGKAFVTAMMLGYEAVCRIAEAATRAVEDERGFHCPATNGQFGAAVAAGKLLDFDPTQLVNAMGIAGSHSAGLLEFVWEGAMTKRLHVGRAAQMGLESALLAGKGFTGPSTVLEGKHGYLNVFSPSPKMEGLLADLGRIWIVKGLHIKPFACHGTQQAVVQGLNAFKARRPMNVSDIRRVIVAGSRFMMHKHEEREPKSVMGAQYSMPFMVAIALSRDIADPYVINEDTLWDKEVRDLATRVETRVDPRFAEYSMHDPHAEVTIEWSKERHVIDIAGFKGLPETPFDFDDICTKFRRNATRILGKERAEEVIAQVSNLEQLTDLAEVARLTGVGGGR